MADALDSKVNWGFRPMPLSDAASCDAASGSVQAGNNDRGPQNRWFRLIWATFGHRMVASAKGA